MEVELEPRVKPLAFKVKGMSRESLSQKATHVLDTDLRTHWSTGTNTKEWILLELDVSISLSLSHAVYVCIYMYACSSICFCLLCLILDALLFELCVNLSSDYIWMRFFFLFILVLFFLPFVFQYQIM